MTVISLKPWGDSHENKYYKKEYRLLLDVFSIATWVMNSHKYEPDPKSAPYENLEQKFMAFAKDFGFKNLVEYDPKRETYSPTSEYEELESDMQFIEEFEGNGIKNLIISKND